MLPHNYLLCNSISYYRLFQKKYFRLDMALRKRSSVQVCYAHLCMKFIFVNLLFYTCLSLLTHHAKSESDTNFIMSSYKQKRSTVDCNHCLTKVMAKTLKKAQGDRPGQYIGQTLNQVRHGHGKYIYNNTFFAYEGDWLEGNCVENS